MGKLLLPLVFSLVFLGLGTQAFADDLTDPPWGDAATTQNAVEFIFRDTGATDDCTTSALTGTFAVSSTIGPSIYPLHGAPEGVAAFNNFANVIVPNFKDELNSKRLQIEQTFCPKNMGADPADTGSISVIVGNDPLGAVCFSEPKSQPQFNLPGQTAGSTYWVTSGNCIPNPNWEKITLTWKGTDWALIQVVVNTVSEDTSEDDTEVNINDMNGLQTAVGGDLIPLDSTMILAAGAQYTAAWMIPVIVSGIGFAIVIARKF